MKNGVLKGIFAAFRVCMMLLFCIKTDAQFAPSWAPARDFAAKEALALGKEALQGFDHVLTGDANITSFPWYVEFLNPALIHPAFYKSIIQRIATRFIYNQLPILRSSVIKNFFLGPKCIDSMNKRMMTVGKEGLLSFVLKWNTNCQKMFFIQYNNFLLDEESKQGQIDFLVLINTKNRKEIEEKVDKICKNVILYKKEFEGYIENEDISFKNLCKKTFKDYKETFKENVIKPYVSSACSQASGYVIGRVAGAVAPKSLVDKAVLLHIPLFIPAIIRTNAHVVKWFDIKLDLRKVPGFSRVDKNNKFVNNAQIKVMPLLSGMVHGFNASAQARLSA